MRHDPQDGQAGDRGPAVRGTTRSWSSRRSEQHRRGAGPDRREGARHRRPHLGQASVAAGSSSRLRRLGPELPLGRGRGEAALAAPAPGVPTLGPGPRRAPGHRLVHRGRLADLLRRVGLEPVALRAGGQRPAGAHHHADAGRVPRGDGGRSQDRAHRPDGMSEGRSRGQRGRADTGLRALRHPLRVPARLLRGGRPRIQGGRRSAVPLRPAGPDRARRRLGQRVRRQRRLSQLVRRGKRGAALRDRGRPGAAPGRGAGVVPALAVVAAAAAPGRTAPGRQVVLRAHRLGPLLGAPRARRPRRHRDRRRGPGGGRAPRRSRRPPPAGGAG